MKPENPIEEVWRIKADLAREAGYDTRRFMENLRQWEAEHPHPGRVVNSAEELQELMGLEERQRAEAASLALREEPPKTE